MIVINDRREMRQKIKSISQHSEFNAEVFKYLDTDSEFQALEWFVSRLDSNSNFFKVESHTILTRTLFLTNFYKLTVSFSGQNITFETTDGNQYQVNWESANTLSQLLYDILQVTENTQSVFKYNEFRQETRSITDHLDENHQPRNTWRKILALTENYFAPLGLEKEDA